MRLIGVFLVAAACQSTPPTARPSPLVPPTGAGPQTSQGLIDRGEYVAAVGGCAACHGADLGGGSAHEMTDGDTTTTWRGPNITPDPETGIGGWTDEQLAAAIRDGVRPDGRKLASLMPYRGYHAMTDDDTQALVAYLEARPPVHRAIDRGHLNMPPADVPKAREQLTRGAYLASVMHCAACHGKTYTGELGPNITSDRDHGIGEWSTRDIERAVRGMVAKNGHVIQPPMAEYGKDWAKLTDDDARALAGFVHGIAPAVAATPTAK